jgi:serine/threonine-protein kinase
VYVRDATLFGVRFDERSLEVSGEAVPLEQGIQGAAVGTSGSAHWAWSPSGLAAFVPGVGVNTNRTLVWVARDGRMEPTSSPARPITYAPSGIRLSPNGDLAALTIEASGSGTSGATNANMPSDSADVWIWNVRRNTMSRLSTNGKASGPVWTPDGRTVCYRVDIEALCQPADGGGRVQSFGTLAELLSVRTFSPDGTQLLVNVSGGKTAADIFVMTAGAQAAPRPLIRTQSVDAQPIISPDGKWLAYQSNESGTSEVYVRPFPDVDRGRWPVSTESGFEARWSKDGRELFYLSGGGPLPRLIWSVAIAPGSEFSAGPPRLLAKLSGTTSVAYDVAPDGRFLFHVPASGNPAATRLPFSEIVVIEHWFDELRARMQTAGR